jgi:UDP-N-acetylglucosamine 2-epimerase (non-hydrolysing)
MIHVVIGTKAQLIKMAPILKVLKDRNIEYNYISTGQHKETIKDILDNFEIKEADVVLYDGKDITSIFAMFVWSLRIIWQTIFKRKQIFNNDKNGIVLVHGDTFSTLLGAIMGKIGGLKVGHVESGLRSFNLFQPFPEELTRLLVFRLSDFMFCPGDWTVSNLKKYKGKKVNTEINTLADSLKTALPAIQKISDVAIPQKNYGIVTLHRFENFKDHESALKVVEAVERIAQKQHLLFIMHKPTEKNLIKHNLLNRLKSCANIELRSRYDYFRFIKLILSADFVVSDGGSNQEECYYLGKPVILLRNVTERQEGIGKNAVISKFQPEIIDEFINNVSNYKHDMHEITASPSEQIVDTCLPFCK